MSDDSNRSQDDRPNGVRKFYESPVWISRQAFSATVGILAVILLTILLILGSEYPVLPDEGVYSAQASSLSAGSWSSPRPAPDIDPDGLFDPILPTAVDGNMHIPYGRHPLYSLFLTGFYRAAGPMGLFLPSIIGGLLAATCAGIIARMVNPKYGIPVLLLTAVGSPILFNCYTVTAHNLGTGLAGLAVLAAFRAQASPLRHSWYWWLVLASAATLIPCIRSEGSVFAGALSLALLFVFVLTLRSSPQWQLATVGIAIGAFAVVGYRLDIIWTNSIAPFVGFYTSPTDAIGGSQAGPLNAIRVALLQPWSYGGDASVPALIILISFVLSAVALKVRPSFQLLPIALLLFAAFSSLLWHFGYLTLVTGLVATMPVLVFTVTGLRRVDLRDTTTQLLAAISVVSISVLLVTIYGDGGAAQWGGRLLQITLPTLIPLCVLGLHNSFRPLRHTGAVVGLTSIVIVIGATSALSLRVNASYREISRKLVVSTSRAFEETEDEIRPGGRIVTLWSRGTRDGTSRLFWAHYNRLVLLNVPFAASYALVERAGDHGYDAVIVVTDAPDWALQEADEKWSNHLLLQRGESVGTAGPNRIFVFSKSKG